MCNESCSGVSAGGHIKASRRGQKGQSLQNSDKNKFFQSNKNTFYNTDLKTWKILSCNHCIDLKCGVSGWCIQIASTNEHIFFYCLVIFCTDKVERSIKASVFIFPVEHDSFVLKIVSLVIQILSGVWKQWDKIKQVSLDPLTAERRRGGRDKKYVSLNHTGILFAAHLQQIILETVTVATREDHL